MPYIHGKSIIKIAVVDDHEMFREAISTMIDGFKNCKVVIQAASGRELLEKLEQKSNIDLVLLDIAMPGMDGFDTARNLRSRFPEIKLLFCTMFNNELAICRMIGTGGHGCIGKDASLSELKKALFQIMKNGYSFSGTKGKMVYDNERNRHKQQLKNYLLSETELRFLKLICTEKPYKEIATDLDLTERQVDYLREELFSCFEVHSRIGLVHHAFHGGVQTLQLN